MPRNYSIASRVVHPHIKLTREAFPRARATRVLRNDGDEYFGAFLNRTSVRILLDFLNRTFRLRSCDIEIDGNFPVPCTQYYAKRCVAPCVASLCSRDQYLEMLQFVRQFLRDDRDQLEAELSKKIEHVSSDLDFETAALFRDILASVRKFWSEPRWQVWLDDAVDTFELEELEGINFVIIVTQRGRRTLGELVFALPKSSDADAGIAIRDVIEQLYVHHVPREIRVPQDFPWRGDAARKLVTKFGRKINITVSSDANRRVTSDRAIDLTKAWLALQRAASRPTATQIQEEMKTVFGLSRRPKRIEAFDVADISSTGFTAGVSVWQDGKERPEKYQHWTSDRASELDTLRAFVADRVSRTTPDLILIDGGRTHLKAAADGISHIGKKPRVVAAVKPKGRHSSISHFLTDDGGRVDFDPDVGSFRLLQRLRDEAHDLANATHRLNRDSMHFYELAAMLPSLNERERQTLLREFGSIRELAALDVVEYAKRFGSEKAECVAADLTVFRAGRSPTPQPLIVPIRFVETDGEAEDLIPIETR